MLTLPSLARAQDSLRIESVGLGDYYSYGALTPLRVHVPAVPGAQSLALAVTIHSGSMIQHRNVFRSDKFVKHFQLTAGQPLEAEMPIVIPQAAWRELVVTASTPDGRSVGRASSDLEGLFGLFGGQYLAAIYCKDQPTCQNAQAQLAFGGNSEASAEKGKNLRLITFGEARGNWWDYGGARLVVIAGPIAGFSDGERRALENYARGGGTIALLEEEAGDKDFLAAYRQGTLSSVAIQIGRGKLFRLRSMASKDLAQAFPSQLLERLGPLGVFAGQSAEFIQLTGIAFTFPRLRWLIIWLAIYLLVVGPVNFAILRRLTRLEWGWTTVCVLAAVFAAGFYLSSSARRPANYTLDSATVYWMDGRSGEAAVDAGLRISAPARGNVRLSVNDDDLVVTPSIVPFTNEADTQIGADMTDKARVDQGWDVEVGPNSVVKMPMLSWSFQDLEFVGFRRFAGTMHWTSAGRLKNDTGVSFREAMYFDFSANKQYVLTQVAAGQEIDLAGINSSAIYSAQRSAQYPDVGFGVVPSLRSAQHSAGSFSVAELPYLSYKFQSGQMFAGLSDEPIPDAALKPPAVPRTALALTLVSVGEK
jgi:hypothetical protein